MKLTTGVLAVTNRPWMLPWLGKQIAKQTRKPDEIIVVTNAPDGYMRMVLRDLLPKDVTTYVCVDPVATPTTLGGLRQLALDWATADVVSWFDDDDWYHPRRLELATRPIEADYVDVSCFPLTHLYFVKEGRFVEYPEISGYALPSTSWRRKIAVQQQFPRVHATEERGWIQPLLHGYIDAAGRLRKPLIPAHRHHYESAYVGIPGRVGGVVTVHGDNTWHYNHKASSLQYVEATPWPRRAPPDVSQEDWNWSERFLNDFLVFRNHKDLG